MWMVYFKLNILNNSVNDVTIISICENSTFVEHEQKAQIQNRFREWIFFENHDDDDNNDDSDDYDDYAGYDNDLMKRSRRSSRKTKQCQWQ